MGTSAGHDWLAAPSAGRDWLLAPSGCYWMLAPLILGSRLVLHFGSSDSYILVTDVQGFCEFS